MYVCPIAPNWISEEKTYIAHSAVWEVFEAKQEAAPKLDREVLGDEGESKRELCSCTSSWRNRAETYAGRSSVFPLLKGKSVPQARNGGRKPPC